MQACDTRCFCWGGPWALSASAEDQVSCGPGCICHLSVLPPAHCLPLLLWLPEAVWHLCGPLIIWHQPVNPANSAFWEPQWSHYVWIKLGVITALLARTSDPDGNYRKAASPPPEAGTTAEEVCLGQSYILYTLCTHPLRPGWLPASELPRGTSRILLGLNGLDCESGSWRVCRI